MKATKILLATDFSAHSETARQFATSLARDSGALMLIVHVQEPPGDYAATGFAGVVPTDEAELHRLLLEVTPTDPDVEYSHIMLKGAPADEIIRCAENEAVDYIVMGSNGQTGLRKLMQGGVAQKVVRRAACPVLTVKQPRKVTEEIEA